MIERFTICVNGVEILLIDRFIIDMGMLSYLKGKTNKRLDNCLLDLLKYVRYKTFHCLIKLTKGKVTTPINIIQERHLHSLTLSTGSVKAEGPNTWTVFGEDGRSSYIKAIGCL